MKSKTDGIKPKRMVGGMLNFVPLRGYAPDKMSSTWLEEKSAEWFKVSKVYPQYIIFQGLHYRKLDKNGEWKEYDPNEDTPES